MRSLRQQLRVIVFLASHLTRVVRVPLKKRMKKRQSVHVDAVDIADTGTARAKSKLVLPRRPQALLRHRMSCPKMLRRTIANVNLDVWTSPFRMTLRLAPQTLANGHSPCEDCLSKTSPPFSLKSRRWHLPLSLTFAMESDVQILSRTVSSFELQAPCCPLLFLQS
jgi:hypothetical protein